MPDAEELAQFVADRAKESPSVRRVVEDVRLFDGLLEHAGWQRLAQKVQGRKEAFFASLGRKLMAGGKVADQEIEFYRGWFAGAEYVIEMPAKAEESLEQAAREAWRIAQVEAAREAEEASPYLDDPTGGD